MSSLAGGNLSFAQEHPASDEGTRPAAAQACAAGRAGETHGTLLGAAACGLQPVLESQRDTLLGLAAWDHTLLGAFELGARLLHLSRIGAMPAGPAAVVSPANRVVRFSTNGSTGSLGSLAASFRLDQLQRQGMNVNMNSPFGSFRLTYREIFSGRPNSLGGGVGQASAAATYTTPRFGAGGLMNFSAAALMGTGPINTLLGGGFGSSAIGGNGPGRKSQNSPTVALKLTF